MKLIMLGTGGFIPTDSAQTACYFLPEVGVLLDAGSGLYRLSQYLQTTDLDVFLTHAHGDHTNGLVWLFGSFVTRDLRACAEGTEESSISSIVDRANQRLHAVRVHGTQPALDFAQKRLEPYGMDWRLLSGPVTLPQGGTLTYFDVGHNDEVGFRLDWPGHSLAYVTDTTARPDSGYIEHIRGVDLLLHDCNGPDRMTGLTTHIGHSVTSAVARVAALAQVKRLILIHKNPLGWSLEEDLPAARNIFPSIEIGQDGMEVEF